MLSKNSAFKAFVLAMALGTAFGTAGCRVRQTEEGKMPDVDVKTEGGKMPEYDVDAADVEVKTGKKTVEVPDVDVDVKMPPPDNQKPPQQ
jgi:hypothetical protein